MAKRSKAKPGTGKKAKRGKGRPAHEPEDDTKKMVAMMAAFGNTEDQISQILEITPPTLRKHYAKELRDGFLMANNAVSMNLFRQATKDDPRSIQAAMFWLKTKGGWHEYMVPPVSKPKEEKLGKKEQAARDAQQPDDQTDMGALMQERQSSSVQ